MQEYGNTYSTTGEKRNKQKIFVENLKEKVTLDTKN
jgi:hypothetical protein